MLTPLELIDRIAQLVPPPRTHRHRYYGVLAPNSPLRGAVTAMAQAVLVVTPVVRCTVSDAAHTDAGSVGGGPGMSGEAQVKPQPRAPASYLWAALRPYLRSVPVDLSALRWGHAHHRLHYIQRRHP